MKKNRILIFIVLLLLNFSSSKGSIIESKQQQKMDSLLVLIANQTIDKNIRFQYTCFALKILKNSDHYNAFTNNCVQVANAFYLLNKEKEYLAVINILIRKSTLKKDVEGIAWGTYLKGNYHYVKTEYDSSYYYYSKSERASRTLDYSSLLGSVLIAKSGILNIKKDYINAEINSVKALKIGLSEKNNVVIYNCYVNIGNALLGLQRKEKAIDYYLKAIVKTKDLSGEVQYIGIRAQAYNFLSGAYIKFDDYENASKYALKGLDFDKLKEDDIEIYCYLKKNLTYAQFKLNKLYSDREFVTILKIADSINSIPLQIFTKMHLAEYHLKNKNFAKALQYGSEARTQAHKTTFFEEELKLLLILSEIDAKNSLVYMRRHIALNDSLHNIERATRDKYTRIEFETDEITTAKNTAEEKNTFLENRIWMISIFGFLIVFIIVLGFRTITQKSKTRQLLLEQKQLQADEEIYQLMLDQQQKVEEGKTIEKQRISLDLHDNVMGKLSAIRMNLYPIIMTSEIENKEIFYDQLNDIQQVEKEIRGVAHDLNANLFADDVSFIAVVQEFFAKVKRHTNIHFDLQMGETVAWESISSTVKINLYRIIQEALQNIEKYAEAKNVSVTMSQIDHQVYIIILDDGIGFDTYAKKEGIGLQNMKTRMDEINGTFSIQSTVGEGTKISLIIPV